MARTVDFLFIEFPCFVSGKHLDLVVPRSTSDSEMHSVKIAFWVYNAWKTVHAYLLVSLSPFSWWTVFLISLWSYFYTSLSMYNTHMWGFRTQWMSNGYMNRDVWSCMNSWLSQARPVNIDRVSVARIYFDRLTATLSAFHGGRRSGSRSS